MPSLQQDGSLAYILMSFDPKPKSHLESSDESSDEPSDEPSDESSHESSDDIPF